MIQSKLQMILQRKRATCTSWSKKLLLLFLPQSSLRLTCYHLRRVIGDNPYLNLMEGQRGSQVGEQWGGSLMSSIIQTSGTDEVIVVLPFPIRTSCQGR